MKLIYGKEVAKSLTEEVKREVDKLVAKKERVPKLAIIRVGNRIDDITYERGAKKRMALSGIDCDTYYFEETVSREVFYQKFDEINENPDIDGILLLRPLPISLKEMELIHRMKPEKDVDAISPVSLGKIMNGEKDAFSPCTAKAVIAILKFAEVDLKGKKVTIIGRSNVVGRPLALLFISEDATVTICHTGTDDLEKETRGADIVVAACGSAKLVKREHIAKGAILIDVGINLDEDGNLCGDVDLEDIKDRAGICTPVPGGVGAVTTSVLAKQVLMARKNKTV